MYRGNVKLTGILSWYDESPSWLAAAVAGFGRVCDEIVAVDGAYGLYPGARARSMPQQGEAVLMAAESVGAGCTIHRPKEPWWGNEIEKRNACLRLAGATEPDWVLVFDADIHMLQVNVDSVRGQLEETECQVATFTTLSGKDFLGDAKLAEYAARRPIDSEWTGRTRDIFRYTPTLEYGPLHWAVSRVDDGERHWLRGPFEDRLLLPALDLNASLVAYHRTEDRMLSRRRFARGYYQLRDKLKIEDSTPLKEETERLLALRGEKPDGARSASRPKAYGIVIEEEEA